jgi:hypothetical protein
VSRPGLLLLLLCWLGGAVALEEDPLPNGAYYKAEHRLKEHFSSVGLDYPPARVQLIAFKEGRLLELWVWQNRRWRHVYDYPIFAASGEAGPKLREGDKQVPEGFYRVEAFNPNSNFHLSLKLDFPNPYDWSKARAEQRANPGSNIFIHGSAWSAGCLAIGNRAVEELYMLAVRVGIERLHVLIAPFDFRISNRRTMPESPVWVSELYDYLRIRLGQFPLREKLKSVSLSGR